MHSLNRLVAAASVASAFPVCAQPTVIDLDTRPYQPSILDRYPSPQFRRVHTASGDRATFITRIADIETSLYPQSAVWISDGTAAGTRQLAVSERSNLSSPEMNPPIEFRGQLYRLPIDNFGSLPWLSQSPGGCEATPIAMRSSGRGPGAALQDRLVLFSYVAGSGNGFFKQTADAPAEFVPAFSSSVFFGHYAAVSSFLAFTVMQNGQNAKPYATDGTLTGTRQLATIVAGGSGSDPYDFYAAASKVYFFADYPSASSMSVWVTDGTPAGTFAVLTGIGQPTLLCTMGDRLYFSGTSAATGNELYTSDGTVAGTGLVADLVVGSGGLSPRYVGQFDGKMYFTGNGTLFSTQGTASSTHQVSSHWSTSGTQDCPGMHSTDTHAVLGLATGTSTTQYSLVRLSMDGSDPVVIDAGPIRPRLLRAGDRVIYERLTSTGGSAGLFAVNIDVGDPTFITSRVSPASGSPPWIVQIDPQWIEANGRAFFFDSRYDGVWATDGTDAGTTQVVSCNHATVSSKAHIGGGTGNESLLKIVRDGSLINFSTLGSLATVAPLVPADSKQLYNAERSDGPIGFSTFSNTTGWSFYRLEQEGATPELLGSLGLTSAPSCTSCSLTTTTLGEHTLVRSSSPTELWLVQPGNTFVSLDSANRPTISAGPVALGGEWYFLGRASTGADTGKYGLWRTRGTPDTTNLVSYLALNGEAVTSVSSTLVPTSGMLIFGATTASTGHEFWRSDGTAAGTGLVTDLTSGTASSFTSYGSKIRGPHNTAIFNGMLGSAQSNQLYISDGTPAGTRLFVDFSDPSQGIPTPLVTIGNRLFVATSDAVAGNSILVFDGDEVHVHTIRLAGEGSPSGYQSYIGSRDGRIYFVGSTCAYGAEIWTSDGTDQGTFMMGEINPGSRSTVVSSSHLAADHLLVAAYDDDAGLELFSFLLPCQADVNSDHVVDFFDYLDFVQRLASLDSLADYNLDGELDAMDYLDFVRDFAGGC